MSAKEALAVLESGQPKKVVSHTKEFQEVQRLGSEIILGHVALGDKYKQLCLYIRNNQVAQKEATAALLGLGFVKTRVSEILKVATAPDKTWDSYYASELGFNKVLRLTRGHVETVSEVIDVEGTVLAETAEAQHRIEVEAEEGKGAAGVGGPNKGKEGSHRESLSPEDVRERMVAMAGKLIAFAAKHSCWDREWTAPLADRSWKLVLSSKSLRAEKPSSKKPRREKPTQQNEKGGE